MKHILLAGVVLASMTGAPNMVPPSQPQNLIDELRKHHLTMPIGGVSAESIKGSFYQGRDAKRMHRAADFIAPRGTPIHAVDDGTLARLFNSKAGGLTLYQVDPTERFVYYYAHLDGYAAGLKEGQKIDRGQLLGYVGSTGNADPKSPHLHFAIWQTTPHDIWDGIAIDPYEIFRGQTPRPKEPPATAKRQQLQWI